MHITSGPDGADHPIFDDAQQCSLGAGRQLADIAGIARRDVSYAGLKDRHAITTQWYSVWLPGKEAPDWQPQLPESSQIIEQVHRFSDLT